MCCIPCSGVLSDSMHATCATGCTGAASSRACIPLIPNHMFLLAIDSTRLQYLPTCLILILSLIGRQLERGASDTGSSDMHMMVLHLHLMHCRCSWRQQAAVTRRSWRLTWASTRPTWSRCAFDILRCMSSSPSDCQSDMHAYSSAGLVHDDSGRLA